VTQRTAGRRKKKATAGRRRTAANKTATDAFSTLESYLPAGSKQRSAAKIAAAAGGALLAAAVLGVGPAALAGVAGYLVYRETHR
jgi:hypothetical protein